MYELAVYIVKRFPKFKGSSTVLHIVLGFLSVVIPMALSYPIGYLTVGVAIGSSLNIYLAYAKERSDFKRNGKIADDSIGDFLATLSAGQLVVILYFIFK